MLNLRQMELPGDQRAFKWFKQITLFGKYPLLFDENLILGYRNLRTRFGIGGLFILQGRYKAPTTSF